MFRSLYFWIATAIFLIVTFVAVAKVIPPAIADFTNSRSSIKDLQAKLAGEKKFTTTVTELGKNQTELTHYYNLAQEALPDKPDSEELMLQLDGMLASLDMSSATTSVPLAPPTKAATEKTGNTVVAAPPAELTVTITGNFDYNKAKSLLVGLRELIRWNKVTGFGITQSGTTGSVNVTFKAYYRTTKPKTFSGTADLLTKAKTALDTYHSYTTRPDATNEGTYGKPDPFISP